jgi:hypothetical protein
VVSLVVGLLLLAGLIFLVILFAIGEDRLECYATVGGVTSVLMVLLGFVGYFLGLIFGIISVFERRRKKIFSFLGIILNAVGLALLLFIMLLIIASTKR